MPDEFEQNEFTSPAPTKLPGQLSFGWDLDEEETPQPSASTGQSTGKTSARNKNKTVVNQPAERSSQKDAEGEKKSGAKKLKPKAKARKAKRGKSAPTKTTSAIPEADAAAVIAEPATETIALPVPNEVVSDGDSDSNSTPEPLHPVSPAASAAVLPVDVPEKASDDLRKLNGKKTASSKSAAKKTKKGRTKSKTAAAPTAATETTAAGQTRKTQSTDFALATVPKDTQPPYSTETAPVPAPAPATATAPAPAPVTATEAIAVDGVQSGDQLSTSEEPTVDVSPDKRRAGKTTTTAKAKARKPTANPDRNYAETMEYLPLKWGAKLAQVGFGFWKVDKDQTAEVCYQAIKTGYRHLDCACDYGNEVEVGQGIAAAISDGLCEREDLWVTSKLWNTYHAAEHVRPAFERSLNDLGLDYLDLYLIHFPLAQKFVPFEKRYPPGWFTDPDATNPVVEEAKISIRETWQAMEELAKEGLIKQIGVCNFTTGLLRDLLSYCHIRPTVTQVETHPQLTQQRLLRYCQQERIAYTAFSPLGAQSYFTLGMADPAESVLEHPIVAEIAAAVGKTAAQVVLRWGVQRGTAVIPKTSSVERMRENINIFDFELTSQQMAAIDSLDQHRRYNDPGHFGEAAFNTFLPIYD